MTVIGIILVGLLGLGLVYFTFRIWGLLFVRTTSDLNTLHRYQRLPIWGPLALKKLEAIYGKQLEDCTAVKEARRIKDVVWKYDLLSLQLPAYLKLDTLTFNEKMKALKEGAGDEAVLLKVIDEIDRFPCSDDDVVYSSAMEALRPFTEKRIHEATTVKELAPLLSEGKELLELGFWKQGLDRIDETLSPLFESKLRKLILQEARAASQFNDVGNDCFQTKCEDLDVNLLVATKKTLLCLMARPHPFWSSDKALSEINFALMKFLEQQNECCS